MRTLSPEKTMDIHYINLERRKDRDATFLQLNSHLTGLRRVDAVDGTKLQEEQLIRAGIIAEHLPTYSPGALGCAMSHKSVWEDCARRESGGTVAEDDAIFNLYFARKASAVIQSLPVDWDIILWGWNFNGGLEVGLMEGLGESLMIFNRTKLGTKIHEFRKMEYDVMPLRLCGVFGLIAYSFSPKGARLLLEKCFPLRKELIDVPSIGRILGIPSMSEHMRSSGLDIALNKHYPTLKSYVAIPPLVWTENDKSQSDVNNI